MITAGSDQIMEEERHLGDISISFSSTLSRIPTPTHSTSHHSKIRHQRNEHTSWLRHRPLRTYNLLLLIFLTFSCCISLSSASLIYLDEHMVEPGDVDDLDVSEDLGSAFSRLAHSGTILVDQRPPPDPATWILATENDDLQRRGLNNKNEGSSSSTTLKTTTSTLAPTSTSTGLSVAATQSSSPLPSPFDSGFSSNVTESCAAFVNGFLSNSTFKSCLPFSLLLQNSNSFFQASKSLVRITETLDATCAANVTTCTTLMNALAANITTDAACASDLATQNPLIEQAHLGLLAYKPLYAASCLRNPETSSYCYADAITNSSNPTDSYIYFLPLNVSLPGGSQPTCDSCLKNTMAVFEAGSSDRSSALAYDYVAAAMQVNVQCGPGFVNQSLAAAVASGASTPLPFAYGNTGLVALVVLVASWLL